MSLTILKIDIERLKLFNFQIVLDMELQFGPPAMLLQERVNNKINKPSIDTYIC